MEFLKAGIGEAVDSVSGMQKNEAAIAETIENNVRSKIVKEHLSDPAYFSSMSELLDVIIKLLRAKHITYEEYLRRIADLVVKTNAGAADGTPSSLDTPGKRALFNNLNRDAELALKVDEAVRNSRPNNWRGSQPKERVIQQALFMILDDLAEVDRVFLIIKAQPEY